MGLLKAGNRDASAWNAPDDAGDAPRLDHAIASMRRRAVQALSGSEGNVGTLIDVLRQETENSVRQAAFIALATMNSGAAAEGVAALLCEADPALRNGALETLAAMPEHAGALLEPLGRHEDPDVRIFAVLLAGELAHIDTSSWLIDLAGREADPNVCSNLAEALGGAGVRAAIPALEGIAARFADQPFLVFSVDSAIQRLGER